MRQFAAVRLALALAFLLTLFVSPPTSAQTPVSIYVFSTPGTDGYVDGGSKARDASLQEVKDSLAKSDRLRLVDTPEAATIQLELTNAKWSKWSGRALTATLTHGAYRLELAAKDANSPMHPGRTARKVIARQVIEWVTDNAVRLQPAVDSAR